MQLHYDAVAPGGWAALYMMFQPHVEAVLDRHSKSLSTVDIHQGYTVSAMEQDDLGVVVRGMDAKGQLTSMRARFVVGADGGSSFARRTVSTNAFDYGSRRIGWFATSTSTARCKGCRRSDRFVIPRSPPRSCRSGPEHQRFSFMLEVDESIEIATRPANVWSRVEAYLQEDDAELIRAVSYVFRSRIMKEWQRGRIFLAGDAAHEMPPFLGQGMCSGIRDSHNLAWKLDMVLSGLADAELLSTYQAEREPHVRFITEKAIELGRVQTLRDPVAARGRDERLLAQRRANEAPAKIRLPGLHGGFFANNGNVFPQSVVRSDDRIERFDDVVQPGWCVVTVDPGLLGQLTDADLRAWRGIGGQIVTMSQKGRQSPLEDVEGAYGEWFAANGGKAAVVRAGLVCIWHGSRP